MSRPRRHPYPQHPRNRCLLEGLESRLLLSTTLLPLTDHKDLVIDATRNQLIIVSNGGVISRYDIANQTLLPNPIALGIAAGGADISPDGQYLYVSSTALSSTLKLDRVNLSTGVIDIFTLAVSPNAGLFDCTVLADGRVELTTVAPGQPQKFYKLDPLTSTIVPEAALTTGYVNREPAAIFRSADRQSAIFMEPQNNSFLPAVRDVGGIRLFQLPNGSGSQLSSGVLTISSATTAAFNRDGTLYAVDLPNGITLFNQSGASVSTLSGIHGGLAFSATDGRLYIADPTDDAIRIVDTTTASQPLTLTEISIESALSGIGNFANGQIAVSPDGSRLFVTTTSGIVMMDQPAHAWDTTVGLAAASAVASYEPMTLTATVQANDPDAGSSHPTGRVWFYDTVQGVSTLLGSSLIVNDQAQFTIDSLSVDTHALSMAYSGDGNFAFNSLSETVPLTVNKALPQVSVNVQDYASNAIQSVPFTVQIALTATNAPPLSGSAGVWVDNVLAGTVQIANGVGTLQLAALPAGAHLVRADFAGNSRLLSASGSQSVQVVRQVTDVTVDYFTDNSQRVTAHVDSSFELAITGSISLKENGVRLFTMPLIQGAATFDLGLLPAGSHSFTYSYSGDSVFLPDDFVAGARNIYLSTSTFLSSSVTAPHVGDTVTLTARVTPGVPGHVDFRNGSVLIGSSTVAAGVATNSLTINQRGSYALSATFVPDSATYQRTSDSLKIVGYNATVIDLLALYTPEEYTAEGSLAAMLAHIQSQIDDTNDAFANSLIPVSLRLAALAATDYHEAGDLGIDLDRLAEPDDGYMDDIHLIRDRVAADLVVLLDADYVTDDTGSTLGIGYELTADAYGSPTQDEVAFLVVAEAANDNDYVLAHEIGHTLGAIHAAGDPGGSGLFSYAHGYRFTGNDNKVYHDVMAYDPGIAIPYYSNPDVTYKGHAVGNSNANAAAVIEYSAPSVADYRTISLTGTVTSATASAISGRVINPHGLDGTTTIRIDIDGVTSGWVHSELGLGDPLVGFTSQTFTYKLPPLAAGKHVVTVYGLADGAGVPVLLGTRSITANRILSSPQALTLVAGQPLGTALKTMVVDGAGFIVTDSSARLSLSVASGPLGGSFSGIPKALVSQGIATFNDVTLTKAGTYKLTVSDGKLIMSTATITVVPDGASAHLVLASGTASGAMPAKALSPLVFNLQDQFGNVLATNHSVITLSMISGPTGGTLTGTTGVALSNGAAKFSNVLLNRAGDYQLAATVTGSAPLQFNQTVLPGITTVPAPKPAASYAFGQTIALTTTLKYSSALAGAFTGVATLTDQNDIVRGTATLTGGGVAKFTFLTPDPGSYVCKINYPGDLAHEAGSSSTFTLQVRAATTTTVLTASSSAPVFGQIFTLTAAVKSATAGAIARTGSINFYDGVTLLGSVTLDSASMAAWTFTPSSTGAHSYKALYTGDIDFAASASAVLKSTVAKVKTTASLVPSIVSPVPTGQAFDLTVHVGVVAPGAAPLAGNLVTIKDGSKIIGTLTLDGAGNATMAALAYTASGLHSFTAVYAGDINSSPINSTLLKLAIT